MINGKTDRNRKILQKANRVQVLKLTATMHWRFIHTWWDYLETQWPHWSTFSISSRLVKNILLIIWYAAPLLVFPCTTSDLVTVMWKEKKNPITCLVSMKSHSQSCAVLCRDTCLIQSLPSLIFSCNRCCHHFDQIGDFYSFSWYSATFSKLFKAVSRECCTIVVVQLAIKTLKRKEKKNTLPDLPRRV